MVLGLLLTMGMATAGEPVRPAMADRTADGSVAWVALTDGTHLVLADPGDVEDVPYAWWQVRELGGRIERLAEGERRAWCAPFHRCALFPLTGGEWLGFEVPHLGREKLVRLESGAVVVEIQRTSTIRTASAGFVGRDGRVGSWSRHTWRREVPITPGFDLEAIPMVDHMPVYPGAHVPAVRHDGGLALSDTPTLDRIPYSGSLTGVLSLTPGVSRDGTFDGEPLQWRVDGGPPLMSAGLLPPTNGVGR